jgi:3-phenylpropionate/trans-cinnamate dioxygenase ferredoxin component
MPEIVACKVGDVAPNSAIRVDKDGHRLAVVRIGDDWYAIGDECSHEDYSLADGEVFQDEREIECWKHGTTFSLVDGTPQSLPATRPVPVYDVVIDGNDVIVTKA